MATYTTLRTQNPAVVHTTGTVTQTCDIDLSKAGAGGGKLVQNDVIEIFKIPANAYLTSWRLHISESQGTSTTCDVGYTAGGQDWVAAGVTSAACSLGSNGSSNATGKKASVDAVAPLAAETKVYVKFLHTNMDGAGTLRGFVQYTTEFVER